MVRGRSAIAAVLVIALVATLVANPLGLAAVERSSPVGEAEAWGNPSDCFAGVLIEGAMNLGGDTQIPEQCGGDPVDLDEIEEDWLSIYTQAGVAHGSGESFRAVYSNAVTSSNETAFMMAEQATFEAWKNDSAKMEAKTAGREAIRSYYTRMQKNLINRWNTHVASVQNLHERDSSVSGSQIQFSLERWSTEDASFTGFPTRNVTLADGSEKEVRRYTIEIDDPSGATDTYTLDLTQKSEYTVTPNLDPITGEQYNIWVASPPDTEYTSQTLLAHTTWHGMWQDTEAYQTDASSRSDQLVETAWTELQDGNINATDYLSRITLIEEYATDGGGENASFSDVQAALAAQGFQAPEGSTAFMNLSYEMTGRDSPKTAEGLLLSANGPNATGGSWEVGYQYNSTNINGGQIVALLDGGADEIDGNFTINQALDEEGNPIEDPDMNVPDRDYQVSDVSDLNDRIEELGDRIAELNNMTNDGGGGGGGGGIDWSGIPNFLGFLGEIGRYLQFGVVVFAALLVLALFN